MEYNKAVILRGTGFINDEDIAKVIDKGLKEMGFTYVTVDLDGYRIGSMSDIIL